jgi:lipid II:glycine glycyltransferase (peptidoglycan interpeptide bridge formation enzyme)
MSFSVSYIEKEEEWKKFILDQPDTLFVQSPSYGDFYADMGEKYWIVGIYKAGVLVGGSLVVSTHARRGNFLYLPYGPVFSRELMEHSKEWGEAMVLFVDFLTTFAKKSGYDFIKASPFLDDADDIQNLFSKNGFRDAPLHILAETTWLVDVSVEEKDLLKGMRKNHRNLIRRCIRDGVRVEIKTGEAALDRLNDMLDTVAKRHHFHRFSRKYISDEFRTFQKENEAAIFEAYLPDGTLDASAIIMFFGTMANYRHSASLNLDKRLPSSYLIQWEVMREAKKRGMKWYNLWGIAPTDASKEHPFHGITHFKKGFGGQERQLVHCQDLPLSKKYWINWIIQTIRKKKRRF